MSEREFASREDFELLGFERANHFTIGNTLHLNLSRGRKLLATSIGEGNESIWLSHDDKNGEKDLVCIHNRDYDGFITWDRLQTIVVWFLEQSK